MNATEQLRQDGEERDRRIFHQRCEAFLKRWEPDNALDRRDFAAELMLLFRDLQIGQAQAYSRILARQMEVYAPLGTRSLQIVVPKDEPLSDTERPKE